MVGRDSFRRAQPRPLRGRLPRDPDQKWHPRKSLGRAGFVFRSCEFRRPCAMLAEDPTVYYLKDHYLNYTGVLVVYLVSTGTSDATCPE